MNTPSSTSAYVGGRAGRVLLAALLPQLAFGLSYAWISLAPHVEQQSRWSQLATGAIFALPLLSAAVTLLWSSALVSHIPPRSLCWLGMGIFVLGLTVALVWPSEASFIIFYAMLSLGVGYGVNFAGSLVVVAHIFPRRMGAVSGMMTATYALSAVIIVPTMNVLMRDHDWLDALRIVGVSVALFSIVALLFLPALPLSASPAERKSVFQLLSHPRFGAVALVSVLVAPLGTYATSEIGTYAQNLSLQPALAASAVVIMATGTVVGRLCSGIVSDHAGADRVLLVVVALDTVGGIVLWQATTARLLLLAATVIGLSCGGLIGAVPRLAMDNEPCHYSAASGMLFASFSLGGFLGPSIGGALGGKTTAWSVLASLAALGFVVLLFHSTWMARWKIVCSCADAIANARRKTGSEFLWRAYQRMSASLSARRLSLKTAPLPHREGTFWSQLGKQRHRLQQTASKMEEASMQQTRK